MRCGGGEVSIAVSRETGHVATRRGGTQGGCAVEWRTAAEDVREAGQAAPRRGFRWAADRGTDPIPPPSPTDFDHFLFLVGVSWLYETAHDHCTRPLLIECDG